MKQVKTWCYVILNSFVLSWIVACILLVFIGAKYPINLDLSTPLSTPDIQKVIAVAQNGWPYYQYLYIISIISDVALMFVGVVINCVFPTQETLWPKIILLSFITAGIVATISDIIFITLYQILGVIGPHIAAVGLPSLAALFISLENIGNLLGVSCSCLLGAIGLAATYKIVKYLPRVPKFWAYLNLILAVLAAVISVTSLIAIITQGTALMFIALTLLMIVAPVLNVFWLVGFCKQIKKI